MHRIAVLDGPPRRRGRPRRAGKDELLATSGVVTVPLVLSDRTRGLVGRAELEQMRRTAIRVDTGRGPGTDDVAAWLAGTPVRVLTG